VKLSEFDLSDPSTLPKDDQDELVGAAAVGALAIFLLPLFEIGFFGDVALSALIGGGLASYLGLRNDVGSTTRKVVGRSAIVAAEKAKQYERKEQLAEKAKAKAADLWKEAKKSILEK